MAKYRVLIVTVNSAELKTKNNAKIYAKAYVHPDVRLKTKLGSNGGSRPTWNDKFVFSISESFLDGKASFLHFDIYRARKGFPHSLVGKSKFDLNLLVKKSDFEEKVDLEEDQECNYDTSNEEDLYDDENDKDNPRYDNMFEVKQQSDDDVVEEKEKEQEMKAKVGLDVFKGLERKGVLNVEVGLGEYISCLGEFEWHTMAMEYCAFMGQTMEANRKRQLISESIRFITLKFLFLKKTVK
ncbi:C2 calcium-dependent membrane targeting [Quillaja saponaria]|uniref:C2 calcium-dependent membrane targeting n=1 Tax=Quillaja saponaria TaxID=32244 RepID=A0AAD7PP86_QUISA|nr:C2 calcium-dependent membrane targeting [Quillaja saponaria]